MTKLALAKINITLNQSALQYHFHHNKGQQEVLRTLLKKLPHYLVINRHYSILVK